MLSLAVFLYLQGTASVAMGAGTPGVYFPSLTSQTASANAVAGGSGPILQDFNSDANLPGRGQPVRIEDKEYGTSTASHQSKLPFEEWSSRVCKQGSPFVEYFADTFMKKVKAVKEIRKAFQLNNFTEETLSSLYHDGILNTQLKIGNPNAQELANLSYKSIRANFNSIKEDSLLLINAYAAAKFLLYKGGLDTNNALPLAQQYFMTVKRNLQSNKNPTPQENVKAIGKGFDEFAISLGLFDKYSTTMGVSLFASEWNELSANKYSACKTRNSV